MRSPEPVGSCFGKAHEFDGRVAAMVFVNQPLIIIPAMRSNDFNNLTLPTSSKSSSQFRPLKGARTSETAPSAGSPKSAADQADFPKYEHRVN